MSEPLVSICCITYNHKDYISDAIEGFLMQRTIFPIEIIIHDDASTDGTAEIVKKYAEKYPELIVPILQIENQYSKGIRPSPTYVWPKAKGKYIALCEGDDYWIDPYKLQKQVDFLEKNEDFSICFHKVMVWRNNKLYKDSITIRPKNESTITDITKENFIHTPTVMFRNGLIKEFPNWYFLSPIGDHPLYILLGQYGKIKYFDECMAIYRIHKGGMWSQRKKDDIPIIIRSIKTHESMIDFFDGEVKNILTVNTSILYLHLSEIYKKTNKDDLAFDAFKNSIKYSPLLIYEKYFKFKLFIEKLKTFDIFNLYKKLK